MKSVNNELYDMLIGMTKVEIDFYRKILRCNASSNLKKVDMAAKTVRYNIKPHKFFLFNKETEERIRYEVK